ncbi:hypothetical protein [Sphingomonas sp. 1P08PE]|uniref:hypothetical protein n=1 Tax=Sphingomonas sp. 1P08PE TaxID=554122 RepID=UPI0039A3EDB9
MTIDDRALDSLSVAPDGQDKPDDSSGRDPRGDAGQDRSIAKRLQKNPDSVDARLDNGLDESMDGSDPVSISDPSRSDPAPSSGYDDEAERQRDA